MRILLVTAILSLASSAPSLARAETSDTAQLERLSKAGMTLSAEAAARFPVGEQVVRDDTGINVLMDLAHQASFFFMWQLPKELRDKGFRVCGSQAALDSVLTPGKASRVRIPMGERRPFAWRLNDRFNVVITAQSNPRSQDYLPEEKNALTEFVREGGGVVMIGGAAPKSDEELRQWPLNGLATEFGAAFTTESDTMAESQRPLAPLKRGSEWETQMSGKEGRPLVARRTFRKGRVVLISSTALVSWPKEKTEDAKKEKTRKMDFLAQAVKWAGGGSPPVGGSLRLPKESGGGGPLYPELEQRIGNVVVYYAKNQREDLLKTVTVDMPALKKQVEAWLPSPPPDEPMYLILSAGGGGGWAVNAYLPKEVGTISLEGDGILSVLAHELAHTMGGPANDEGQLAGRSPFGDQGEAHAGWFQGKGNAWRNGTRDAGHDPNKMFAFDKDGMALDLAVSRAEYDKKWKKGNDWAKTWWVWQKLDDRYGPAWYPRWKWVQHTRWAGDPRRNLTWDETVEDMSIAVGEDLFPFFHKIGTTLEKDRFSRATFQGQTLELPMAPIEIGPAGPPRLEPIGDYKKPLTPSPAPSGGKKPQ